jgi:hypothetical protein
MLPPTIITAPTSAMARPKAMSISVATAQRSCSSISKRVRRRRAHRAQLIAAVAQGVGDDLAGERGDDRQDQDGLGDDHRRRREENAERAERAAARQQQVDDQADHDRRQGEERVERQQDRALAGKRATASQAPEPSPSAAAHRHALPLTANESATVRTSAGRLDNQAKCGREALRIALVGKLSSGGILGGGATQAI